ncbi:hypothetical protein PLANTIT3_20169 [Plantibacter sp. T3]|nr:hypothetical protein PLANTIT3_20169 [Plantibacter sp. T3]
MRWRERGSQPRARVSGGARSRLRGAVTSAHRAGDSGRHRATQKPPASRGFRAEIQCGDGGI